MCDLLEERGEDSSLQIPHFYIDLNWAAGPGKLMAPPVNFGFMFNLAAVMHLTGIRAWWFSNKDLQHGFILSIAVVCSFYFIFL